MPKDREKNVPDARFDKSKGRSVDDATEPASDFRVAALADAHEWLNIGFEYGTDVLASVANRIEQFDQPFLFVGAQGASLPERVGLASSVLFDEPEPIFARALRRIEGDPHFLIVAEYLCTKGDPGTMDMIYGDSRSQYIGDKIIHSIRPDLATEDELTEALWYWSTGPEYLGILVPVTAASTRILRDGPLDIDPESVAELSSLCAAVVARVFDGDAFLILTDGTVALPQADATPWPEDAGS